MSKAKVLTISAIAVTAFAVSAMLGYIGVSRVAALATNSRISSLIQNLATKFNVSTSDVQKVFDDTRAQQLSSRLDQAVTEGQITADQKNQIIAKRTEIAAKVTEINNKQLTAAERNNELQALRTEVVSWANTNKIPLMFTGFVFGKGEMIGDGDIDGGMGMHRLMGW